MSAQMNVSAFAENMLASIHPARGREGMGWSIERERIDEVLAGEYQVVRELGRGGMGVVFLARDLVLQRLVAIKVLRHEFAANEEWRERFRREARIKARLQHPSIVPVHSFGEAVGERAGNQLPLCYLVMRYVQGESLAARMDRDGALDATITRQILTDLAQALDYAHRDGIVHRDLKPENVLLDRDTGRAMLTDFGVAYIRSLGPADGTARLGEGPNVSVGTPAYMSPEQCTGEPDLDGRSDLYALGVLGYQMLSGRLPFEASTYTAIAAMHVAVLPEALQEKAPDADATLVATIERCLEKQRARRPRTGAELCARLATSPSSWKFSFASLAAKVAAAALMLGVLS